MLVVVSPAKNLDYKTPVATSEYTQPKFMPKTEELVATCQTLAPADLSSLMGISDKLAVLNAERFASFTQPFTPDNARQAMYAFNGDVYAGLDAHSMSVDDVTFAQAHLRILSGLYGVLQPLDLMQPYRLEMGTKLATERGKNLYEFWDDALTEALDKELAEQPHQVLVNLASNEYFSAVKPKALNAQVITPVFKDEKNGKIKIISFYAKKARGLMARYAADHQVENAEDLKFFDVDGYKFDPEQSSETDWVFTRKQEV